MALKTKLLVLFLAVGVIPFAVMGIVALYKSSDALETKAIDQLVAARNTKKKQIERFFNEREGDVGVLMETVNSLKGEALQKLQAVQETRKAQLEGFFAERFGDAKVLASNPDVQQAMESFSIAFREEGGKVGGTAWQQAKERFGPWLSHYQRQYGYYDVFLITEDGDVVYSVCEEPDLGQNVLSGSLKDSSLGDCFAKARTQAAIGDFRPYAPSNGAQAAFVGAPVVRDGKTLGVVAMQIPTDPINAIVQSRAGMGKTGESYLVAKDKTGQSQFRSDMKTMGGGKYVIGYPISTSYIERALSGRTAWSIETDSSGRLVMVTHAPLEIQGLNWAILSKVNLEEVIAPKQEGADDDYYARYIEKYGYYDLFLIHPQGHVFYTVCHEADYDTNIITGKYSSSNLGELTRRVIASKQFGLADFAPYAPSNGQPASFIAQPLLGRDGEVELVVALQLSLDAINGIMACGEEDGMGETGETYLVGQDLRMRSDSRLDKEGRNVIASFAGTVQENGCDTEAARNALAGKTDAHVVEDYNGSEVLSAYAPVEVGETNWALLAEIDTAEAFRAITTLKWAMGILAIVGVAAIVGIALLVARSIALPINRVIQSLSAGADQTTMAAGQVSQAGQSLAEGASEQAASCEETAASVEEMTTVVTQTSQNAVKAKDIAGGARKNAEQGNEAMGRLSSAITDIKTSSDETAKIVKTIDEIAFQTNLLALNAAVEAARAGEAGKGFAVVAEEVRNLAQRAGEAARNTAAMIEESVKNADNGVTINEEVAKSLSEIATGSREVNELIEQIATASNEQAQGIEQINDAVTQLDQVTQSNAANAEESAAAAEELTSQAEELNRMVNELRAIVGGRNAAAASQSPTFQPDRSPQGHRKAQAPKPKAQSQASQPKAQPQASQPKAPAQEETPEPVAEAEELQSF
jgi:methyl-accepting chemotaxis protein